MHAGLYLGFKLIGAIDSFQKIASIAPPRHGPDLSVFQIQSSRISHPVRASQTPQNFGHSLLTLDCREKKQKRRLVHQLANRCPMCPKLFCLYSNSVNNHYRGSHWVRKHTYSINIEVKYQTKSLTYLFFMTPLLFFVTPILWLVIFTTDFALIAFSTSNVFIHTWTLASCMITYS